MPDVFIIDVTEDVVQLIPTLRGYARALTRWSGEADDLVQETLVKAIANQSRFEPGTNLRAWLFTIMRNTFRSNIAKRRRERPGSADCASLQPVTQSSNETYIAGQRVFRAITTLPEPYREILMLVIVTGESYENAAVICKCAVGTVKSRVHRGRRMVIDELGAPTFRDILDTYDRPGYVSHVGRSVQVSDPKTTGAPRKSGF